MVSPSRPSRPKAVDVARRAGVSITAVSFVLNGNDAGNIAPSTRDRILAAAAELGYVPDPVARSMRSRRSHVLGLVTDSIASSPFAGRLLTGAMDAAAERGYVVVAYDSQDHRDREQLAVDELLRRKVDGIVYATMGLREMTALPSTTLPMVLANCTAPGTPYLSVIPDETQAMKTAAEYLVGLGHRRITMLSGPGAGGPGRGAGRSGVPGDRYHDGNMAGPIRSRAFRAALRRLGIQPPEVITAGWTIDAGYAGAIRALGADNGRAKARTDRPSAIFAVTDRVATGVLLATASLGLRVPRDLSVMGMDDQEQLAAHVVPALTTLALPHRAMGNRAVTALLDQIDATPSAGRTRRPGPSRPGPTVSGAVERLTCPLIERDSTAPAR